MVCNICGSLLEEGLCPKCIRDFVEVVREKRLNIINNAMKSIDEEATKVFEEDPTKGRGRGPKWMNLDI